MSDNYILGFDPGGQGAFGWAVSNCDTEPELSHAVSGLTDNAVDAVREAIAAVPRDGVIAAAAIDAPLFYSRRGARAVDEIVRVAIRSAGCPYAAGTVQHPNSLRGACLIQGLLAADELAAKVGDIAISECHPKALVWLWSEARIADARTDHERDALIALWTAWASLVRPANWSDLFYRESEPFCPLGRRVSYWMPLAEGYTWS